MKLSIIIPVYNEEKTVAQVLKRLLEVKLGMKKEIIVIDDGSTDASVSVISKFKFSNSNFKLIKHAKNQGKGAAVRSGINYATGDYIIVQDADLEYHPRQINFLLEPIIAGKAKVVYGTRIDKLPDFRREQSTPQFFLHYLGNRALSFLTSLIYWQWITDMETCYKLFPKKALDGVIINARGFEFEPEITAKLLKKGYRIFEVPITTKPRKYDEGKKLYALRDGPRALWALIKYRFVN